MKYELLRQEKPTNGREKPMPMVRHDLDNLPKAPKEERIKVAAMSDEDIDYSDIPEVNDFSGFVRAESLGTIRPVF
jgi:hypothetical protein